jgi:protein involved in polysaccharide export with SLBB domain
MSYSGADDTIILTVDTDGQVRIPALGGLGVASLSLDAAEDLIEKSLLEQGFFVNPTVSLRVSTYAPVVVGGDVMNPGRFAYLPGMTVAAAVALAGGGQVAGLTRGEVVRALAEAEAGLRTANLDIAFAVARMARLETGLAGADVPLALTAEQRLMVPAPEDADLTAIVRTEAHVLAGERARAAQLLSFWAHEIETIQSQAANFDARIDVQREIVASALANLESSQELTDRGLQTVARLATAEQREADARSRVLELEGAKIAAARAVSAAERERIVFRAAQERDALAALQDTRQALETARYRHQRFEAQIATLAGMFASVPGDQQDFQLRFALQSTRSGRPAGADITPDTVILPGEVLIVSLVPMTDDMGG